VASRNDLFLDHYYFVAHFNEIMSADDTSLFIKEDDRVEPANKMHIRVRRQNGGFSIQSFQVRVYDKFN
jgi:hypothetical protein